MLLPDKFKSDIQSKEVKMLARMVVWKHDDYPYYGGSGSRYYSTHNINLPPGDPGTVQWGWGEELLIPTPDKYHQPILLDIPVMKESIDIENRKFRISNVTIKLSNYEFDGKRFSDLLKYDSILNKIVEIYWHTQSAIAETDGLRVFRGIVRGVDHDDSIVTLKLEDMTELKLGKTLPQTKTSSSQAVPKEHRNKIIPMVYGYVDRAYTVMDVGRVLKADTNPSVSLVTSNSGDYLHIGGSANYTPHPIWGDLTSSTSYGDTGVPPLVVSMGDELGLIPPKTRADIEQDDIDGNTWAGTTQWLGKDDEVEQPGTVKLLTQNWTWGDHRRLLLQAWVSGSSQSIQARYRTDDNLSYSTDWPHSQGGAYGWSTPDRLIDKVTEVLSDRDYTPYRLSSDDLNGFAPAQGDPSGGSSTWGWFYPSWAFADVPGTNFPSGTYLNQNLIRMEIDIAPSFSFTGIGTDLHFAINGHRFPPFTTPNQGLTLEEIVGDSYYIMGKFLSSDSGFLNLQGGSYIRHITGIDLPIYSLIDTEGDGQHAGMTISQFKNIFAFPSFELSADYHGQQWADTGPEDGLIYVWDSINNGSNDQPYVMVTRSWADNLIYLNFGISSYATPTSGNEDVSYSMKIDGWFSEIDFLYIADIEYTSDLKFFLSVNGRKNIVNNTIITNPIYVIKDIARWELGVHYLEIDDESYERAYYIHAGDKFAFSVKEEMKGKDLIADIAKSTLCFPFFNSDGKLAFPSYKENYSFADDVIPDNENLGAISIAKEDVITYKFTKTPPEKVHTMVEFNYYMEYITEAYLKSVPLENFFSQDDALEYNGYEDKYDNVLKFESPYIRDEDTARRVRGRLFNFNKNQKMKINIKLPIKYIGIEVGDIIRFEELLDGAMAYGINYTMFSKVNDQWVYPLFFVSSVSRSIDSITVEAQQIPVITHPEYEIENNTGTYISTSITHHLDEWNDQGGSIDIRDYNPITQEFGEGIEMPEEGMAVEESSYDTSLTIGHYHSGQYHFPTEMTGSTGTEFLEYPFFFKFNTPPGGSGYSGEYQLSHWREPQTWGLTSWHEAAPTDWDTLQEQSYMQMSMLLQEYVVLEFQFISPTTAPLPFKYRLANVGPVGPLYDPAVNFELAWQKQMSANNNVWDDDNWVTLQGEDPDFVPGDEDWDLATDGVRFSDIPHDAWHRVRYGKHFVKAYWLGLLGVVEPLEAAVPEGIWQQTVFPEIGDVNLDGTIDILDVVQVINITLGAVGIPPTSQELNAADMNQDGIINVLDVVALVNSLMG